MNKKILTTAIIGTLMAMGGTALAANQQATSTVTTSNTSDTPYDSIKVSGNTAASVAGIAIPSGAASDLTVYVTGDTTLNIAAESMNSYITGYGTIGDANAYGIYHAAGRQTLTVKGTINGEVQATGSVDKTTAPENESNKASKVVCAYGINNEQNGMLATDAIGNLTVTATGKTGKGSTENDLNSYAGVDGNVYAQGITNGSGTFQTGSIGMMEVTAIGGTDMAGIVKTDEGSAYMNSYVEAKALTNGSGIMKTGDIDSLNVKAVGASVTGGTIINGYAQALAAVTAAGIDQEGNGILTTGKIGNLTVTATGSTATGGTVTGTSGSSDSYAHATATVDTYGVNNMGTGSLTTGDISSMTITATGGSATGGIISGKTAYANAWARAYGLSNWFGKMTVGDLLGMTITAKGGAAAIQTSGSSMDASAYAYGVYAGYGGIVNVTGNVDIKSVSAVGGTTKDEKGNTGSAMAGAYSLYAYQGVINMGVDTTTDSYTANGKTIKLVGDVAAVNAGTVNLVLSGNASYLQGNILNATVQQSSTGTNNITVTNGAAWKPVYDNRYGSFIKADDTSTYDLNKTVTEVSTANLKLTDGGIVDLTWDNATRDPAAAGRTLTIDALSGDGGIFKINSNIAQNKADEITLGSGSTSTSVGIDVAYDPVLATDKLTEASSITGKALVLTDKSGKLTSVNGVADSYNLYDYTPTITANGDGTYSLTKLTITNVHANSTDGDKKTLTTPSRPMRDTRNSRLALHNLWVNGELNNLTKRLGDLRAMEPAEAGIWARYEHNNLNQGDDVSLKYNMFQLGYDKAFAGTNGTTYRGAAMSYAKGTGDYEVSSGDVKETALSLYQTWIGKDGRYYDVILKGGKLMDNFDYNYGSNPFSADYNTWGYAVSGEFGKRLYHGNGVYVEPQVELTLGKINSTDFTTSTGMDVHMDGQNTALTRIGIAVGREIKNIGSYYFKASYYHDFGGGLNLTASDVSTNPFSYSGDVVKNWCVFTLGGARKVGTNCNIFAEFSRFTGQLSNNLQYNVGARWKI